MKPITKLYLKTFLLTGIPFGLIMLVSDLVGGNGFILWKLLSSSFFFGAIMSLMLVFLHRYGISKNGTQGSKDQNLGVNQKKNVQSELNISEIVEKLKANPITQKMRMKKIESGILLETGMSWKSWGEKIKIILQTKAGSKFEYQISSHPKLKTTLVDYGKSLENVNQIENVIKDMA